MINEQFFDKLKTTLEETTKFPSKYMFKFIVPNTPEKINQVHELFNHLGAVIETKKSKNANYVALSTVVMMENAHQVIEKYKQAASIEGIVSI